MNHSFDTEHARSYGVREAILIANLEFWIAKNKANRKHFHKGRHWTYNSVKAWSDLFPYFSAKQIRAGLESLVEQQVLLTDNFNQSSYDRTLWYGFTDEWMAQNGQIDAADSETPFAQTGKSLTSTDTKPDTLASFEFFWKHYPKKKAKDAALKAFAKVPPELHDQMLLAVERQSSSEDWQKEAGKYVPNAATWINGKRWEDEDGDTRTMDIWAGAM
jgi:hypothetical protein